jgi:hypothetical protein
METKMRVLKNESATTTIISIPPCAASGVLKSLHDNKVPCNYMGLDQSGRILMEINYEKQHDALIKELNTYMETSEELLQAITKCITEFVEKQNAEIDKSVKDIKSKYQESRKPGGFLK